MNRAAMRFLGATFGALVLITPAPSQIPNLKTGATVPTLAPLVREVTPTVVSICVHGRICEDNPLYRDRSSGNISTSPSSLRRRSTPPAPALR